VRSGLRLGGWPGLVAVAGTVVALDQGVKAIVRSSLDPGETVDLILGFDLVRTTNRGLAFGVLSDGEGVVLAVTLGVLALLLAWFAIDRDRAGLWLPAGLLVGGALGNLADRIRDDAVTDFLDPPAWPAFNLADVAITVGALMLVLVALATREEPDESAP
jgi:signal peptidase II